MLRKCLVTLVPLVFVLFSVPGQGTMVKKMNLAENGYGMPLQLWLQAWKLGLRIKEIPVELIYNNTSRSFNGELDKPAIRLSYYKEIIEKEMNKDVRSSVTV